MEQDLYVQPTRIFSRIFLLLIKFLFLAPVLFVTYSAMAASTFNSATVDGASSTTVSAGATISTAVNVLTTGNGSNGRWRSTGWRIAGSSGALTCVDHPNYQSSSGNFNETFNIPAPAINGLYNLYLVAYRNDACSQGASTEFILSNAVTVGAVITPPQVSTGGFSGGDVGEGLDLLGDFAYAVNVRGNGGSVVGGATFTNDSAPGVTVTAQNNISNWHNASYGNTSNDNALESIMQSIRWSFAGTDVLTVDLANLVIGESYSLQLLFAESCCTRGFDISVEGTQIIDDFAPYIQQGGTNVTNLGAFVRYDFVATDTTLNIAMGGSAPAYNDNNPILNAFTLERLTLPTADEPEMVAGRVTLSATTTGSVFTHVCFNSAFSVTPLVFTLPTDEGRDPTTIRIRNVTTTGFDISQVEPPGSNGTHSEQTIDFVAIVPGIYNLDGGAIMEVDSVSTTRFQGRNQGGSSWEDVNYQSSFPIPPTIIVAIQTMNNESSTPPSLPSIPFLATAIRNVRTVDFDLALEMAETFSGSVTVPEVVGYIAIDSGKTGQINPGVTYQSIISTDEIRGFPNCRTTALTGFTTTPLVIASQNRRDGGDGGWLRRCSLTNTNVGFYIEEDIQFDSERNHTTENAGILALGGTFTDFTNNCAGPVIDHIEISHDGAGLTCTDETITIRACADNACSSVATTAVDVTLTATGAASTWSQNPITIPANSNAGVTVLLTHRTAETITLGATSLPAVSNAVVCIPDCDIPFSDAGFILSLSNHQSCTTPNLVIQAVQLGATGNSCAPAYSGNQSVNFTFNYTNPLTGTRIPILDSTAMAAASTAQNRTINFDGTASANLSFEYRDAGQINIIVSDAGNNGLSTASVSPIVTPAKLLVSTSDTNNACTGPDYGGCNAFKVAGVAGNAASQFNLDISAVCADNSITPNFQLNAIVLSSNLVAPSGGSNAALGTASTNITTAGTVTVQQTVTEVGAFSISASAPSYLGQIASLIPIATSNTIGRFIPDRFVLVDNTPLLANATCDFTYQDQPFDFSPGVEPQLTLTAVNSAGATTANYGGNTVTNNDFWKFNAAALSSRSYTNQVTTFPGALTATLGTVNIAGETNYDGINTFTLPTDQLTYNKVAATPIALPTSANDSVFNATLKLFLSAASLTDSDGVFYDPDNNAVPDDYLSNDITGTSIRWGRWFMANAFGSELQPLAMVIEAQYFDGNNFVSSITDTCTTTVTPMLSNYSGNLSSGETVLSQGAMISGIIPFNLSAPGNGNDGSVLVTLTAPAWMQYDYDGNSTKDDASATATFGIFNGKNPIIIRRQQY